MEIAGRRATPRGVRLPMQIFWIAGLVWVAWVVGGPARR
jgi:hypothetical protein